jgi:hypothetical protein
MNKCFERTCPVCGNPVVYRERWLRNRAERQKSKCRSCHAKSIIITDEGRIKQSQSWFKKGVRPLNANLRKGKNIEEIYGDKAESIRNKYSNRVVTAESRIKRSNSCKRSGCGLYNKGRRCTEDNKLLFRTQMIERLQKTHKNFHPGYNPEACDVFDQIMKVFGVKIQHALNGGEYHARDIGYFIDGYDKVNNIAFEYDEKRHYDVYGNLRIKDVKKQSDIEKHLKCKVIRIKWNEDHDQKLYERIKKVYNM